MRKILVIDDSSAFLSIVKQILCEEYEVFTAESGEEAMKLLAAESVELILLDINMPEPDGAELLSRIRDDVKLADIPVLLVGQLDDIETMARLLSCGAEDFVTKPLYPDVLLSRVSRALELSKYRRSPETRIKRFETSAASDALTGLWNRTYAAMKISQFLKDGNRGALIVADVDNFGTVNDKLGHIIGDTVLKVISDMLSEIFPDAVIGRIGGDEFAVFLKNPDTKENVSAAVNTMCIRLRAELTEITAGIASISVGVALSPRDGLNFSELYNNAARALYLVKSEGKNNVRFYDSSDSVMTEETKTRHDVENDIRILRQQIREQGRVSGAYWQEYEPFVNIYRFIDREILRTQKNVCLLLITVFGKNGAKPDEEALADCMEKLYAIILGSLRKGDVFTQYSSSQYVILLTSGNSDECGVRVTDRITEVFNNIYSDTELRLRCEATIMNGEA